MNRKALTAKTKAWFGEHLWGLAVLNIVLMLMVLLRSAGYFDPYFPLTINLIIFLTVVLSIFLLSFRDRELFVIATAFLILSGVFRLFEINIWAERASIYMYQAILLAVVLIFVENIKEEFGKTRTR